MKYYLMREVPYGDPETYELTEETFRKFGLDEVDINHLEKGNVVWKGEDATIAYTLVEAIEET
jgi:glycosyltransferase A (GT-A) superfamily protein (DUF2064 family)